MTVRDFLGSSSRGRTGVIVGAAVAALLVGLLVWQHYAATEWTDDAQVDGHVHPVATRVTGTVMAVEVRDNQLVEAGAVLVRIDPKDQRVALDRAEAELADARAAASAADAGVPVTSAATGGQLAATEAGVLQAEAAASVSDREIDAAKAKLVAAQARARQVGVEASRAERDRVRLEPLAAKDEISKQQFDAVSAAADAAKAAVDSAAAAVAEAEQGVAMAESRRRQALAAVGRARADRQAAGSGPQQVAASRSRAEAALARVQLAEAAVKQATLLLDYTTITAPARGIVSRKSVEVGQVVQAGQSLMAVVPLEDVWVTANFKETQLADMRPGQSAAISVDASGHDLTGKIESIAAATGAKFSLLPPDNATGNYVKVVQRVPVKIVLEPGQDPEHLLRPGLSVVVRVRTR